ncbi:hypothetical protein GUJ93_ZPchr0013g33762 [Zizania palustris]|uniref:Uncharacterized protein n=1 Tax=Zizania palustris TaxID=103762 RepID=A0A8J6C0X1_ZIZPA|nr:hypothetical protein GUJ93_ZPchr0013g33762 [Zizania palustris]
MAAPIFDLNLPPDPELHDPINLSTIGEWEGPANGLEYDIAENSSSQGEHLGQQIDLNVMPDEYSNGGSNRRNRRFYPNDLKVAIYLELLSKTTLPTLHRGVSKAIALKFGVPLRVVHVVQRAEQRWT